MSEKNRFPFVCLHLFRINNMQVVVIAVIVAHKQPTDYYNALSISLSLFIRWIVFSSFLLCEFQMASGNGMEWHIIKLDRIESNIFDYPMIFTSISLEFIVLQLITTPFYNVNLVLFPFCFFLLCLFCSLYLLTLSLVYSHSFICRLATCFSFSFWFVGLLCDVIIYIICFLPYVFFMRTPKSHRFPTNFQKQWIVCARLYVCALCKCLYSGHCCT